MKPRFVLLPALLLLALASSVPAQQQAACCKCESWYVLSPTGFGFMREHVGLCGACKTEYGDLDAALQRKLGRLKALREEIDALRRQIDRIQREMDDIRDAIYGLDGKAVDFLNDLLGLASAAEGRPLTEVAEKAQVMLEATKLGKSVGERDWQGVYEFIKSKVQSKVEDVVQQRLLKDSAKAAKDMFAGGASPSAVTAEYLKRNKNIRDLFKLWSLITSAQDYAKSCESLADEIQMWFDRKKEIDGLRKNLAKLEEDMEKTLHEIACIRAELKNMSGEGEAPAEPEAQGEPEETPPEPPSDPEAAPDPGMLEDLPAALGRSADEARGTADRLLDVADCLAPFVYGDVEDLPEPVRVEVLQRLVYLIMNENHDYKGAIDSGREIKTKLDRSRGVKESEAPK